MATETTMTGFTDDWQGERTLAECNMYMLKNPAETCDVSFLVGPTEDIGRAHSYILISRSCVFYSMLCGQWSKEDAIKIPDVSQEFFTGFLRFLYTDDCSFDCRERNWTSLSVKEIRCPQTRVSLCLLSTDQPHSRERLYCSRTGSCL